LVSGLGAGFILAVATACGGSSATQAPPAQASQAAADVLCTVGPAAGAQVAVASFQFTPNATTISTGGTVTWTNGDSTAHTVTFDSGPDCGNLATAGVKSASFSKAGTYAYHCTIHPSMKGTVTVS
jgi:plastocyanin